MSSSMRNVRDLARELGMQPVDLVRELVADGIEVLPVTQRSYRVAAEAFDLWRQKRQQRLAERFTQAQRRAEYVRGSGDHQSQRRPVFKR